MAMVVYDCPRCKAREITLDVLAGVHVGTRYDWQEHWELYCKCRRCFKASVLQVSVREYGYAEAVDNIKKILAIDAGLNAFFNIDGYVSLKDHIGSSPPQYLPPNVETAFKEGTACLAIGCFNASGAMFRLAIDLATKHLLPETDGTTGGPNRQQRKQLHERLIYLFGNGYLPDDLRELAECVKDDGNDGAHDGTLGKADAEDLLDFATQLFERMFTEPEKLRLAKQRRDERRQQGA